MQLHESLIYLAGPSNFLSITIFRWNANFTLKEVYKDTELDFTFLNGRVQIGLIASNKPYDFWIQPVDQITIIIIIIIITIIVIIIAAYWCLLEEQSSLW